MNKTVYILGAGFSISAGAPSQERIVEKIFEIHKERPGTFKEGSIESFVGFLKNSLLIPSYNHHKVPLEDIFTPIDRCLIDNLTYRNLSVNEVKDIRAVIYYLIGKTIEELLNSGELDNKYIKQFASYLVYQCSQRKNNKYNVIDSVSVISTNWDIILDNCIKREIDNKHRLNAVVDYCCHISSYREYDETVKPGLEMLGKGGFNVKLLKLHGSLNWLQCPRCQRVYVDFDNKIAINQYNIKEPCRHCDKNFGHNDSHILTSNLIMPTFLKDLTNPQYKLIWQNAGIELSEASKIVFVGYSLPQADFEMRQLLSRMIRENAEIDVVDFSNGPDDNKYKETKSRYEIFFGKRKITFFEKGAKDYITSHFTS